MKFSKSQDLKLLYWSTEFNSPSKKIIIDMEKEPSHMRTNLSRGKQLFKTPYYMYCINQRIENKYNAFSTLATPYKCIVYPSTWLTKPDQQLANFKPSQAPISLCCSPWKLPLLFTNFTPRNCTITKGQSSDYMHHLYNLDYFTTDSALPLKSNLN